MRDESTNISSQEDHDELEARLGEDGSSPRVFSTEPGLFQILQPPIRNIPSQEVVDHGRPKDRVIAPTGGLGRQLAHRHRSLGLPRGGALSSGEQH